MRLLKHLSIISSYRFTPSSQHLFSTLPPYASSAPITSSVNTSYPHFLLSYPSSLRTSLPITTSYHHLSPFIPPSQVLTMPTA